MKKEYMLVPKSGKGAVWYTSKSEIFKNGIIKAVSKDGFETVLNIKNYVIAK